MKLARRMEALVSGIFTELANARAEKENLGIKVIDLSIGSPDLPPAPHIIETLSKAVQKPTNYTYPIGGKYELHKALANWYKKRFNVDLDPVTEILTLMGSQDGLAHVAQAFINPGDIALVPDPGYPIYSASILLAEGQLYPMPLLEKNQYLPDLSNIPTDIAKKAKMMTINYPNNPVAASANEEFFKRVVAFAKEHNIVVCHDVAYAELAFDGFKPMSFLEVPGAKEVGIEFYSLSKTYNMAGCRIGFAVGNPDVLSALGRIKSNIDYGVFSAVQEAGIAALTGDQTCVAKTAATYQRRRDLLVEGFGELGWLMPKPQASMFIWAPLPAGFQSSMDFCLEFLDKTGVLMVPGNAFGELGQGYVRIALVQREEVLLEALERVRNNFTFAS
ncbi:LL-diaminopimelate aminotransferase apoenzyme [Desulforamulus reducens MI-1]|uniref:Aminotransferase n=1 Tax=Desulforamulus reducens (strain ATCC BAA-1160 / DSM 100696 / MI-1) TaxID=349161 RepID=A4J5T1_DESRM|nr:LL-diaminopimelate aminotransferase [Desulforamulus reducens]ABO50434.1 LL-diaminopimelate aminotransferase apoenzyme [Desulforamulus reducens MI-1]